MQAIGVLFGTAAMLGIVIQAKQMLWPWHVLLPRILALCGELGYFLWFYSPIGALLFVIGAVWTVMTWFRDRRANIGGVVELIELLAWAWMALALH